MTDFSKLERATISLGSTPVEVIRDPFETNIFYFTESSASLALGYAENWLRLTRSRTEGRTMKALQGLGFKPVSLSGKVERDGTGYISANLITLEQFSFLLIYAASKGKKSAIAIQLALSKMSLIDFCRDAFGLHQETIEEKRRRFYLDVARAMNWIEEDRIDILAINEQLEFVGELTGI